MANEDEVIEIGGNTDTVPLQGADGAAAAKETLPPVPSPAAGVSSGGGGDDLVGLKRQIEQGRQEAQQLREVNRRLQAQTAQAAAYVQEAQRRGVSTQELQIEAGMVAAEEQLESLEAQHATAMEGGDFKSSAKLQRRMAGLEAHKALLNERKSFIQQQREQFEAQSAQQQQQPVQRGFSEETRAFLAKHPELIRADGTLKGYALQAHHRALGEGLVADSPGYFDYIERAISGGGGGQAAGGEAPARNGNGGAGAPTIAAPITRGAPPGARPSQFTMTPKMKEAAETAGVSYKEWAENYVRLLKEGRITPIT